jgi:peptide/nickel transport system permease protein
VAFIIYALIDLAPGTILDTISTENLSPEEYQQLVEQYDLDKPMIYRYAKYMLNLLRGDLGRGEATGLDVWREYTSRFPATLKLAIAGLIIGVALAIPLGIIAAKNAGTWVDNLVTGFTMIGISMPSFCLGLILIICFSYKINIFPAGGFDSGIRSMVLPAVASGLLMAGTTARQTRSSMLEVMRADYLRTARAKGVPEKRVIRKHALGNALIPIITSIGNTLAIMLAGSAVVESVFSWPGVGRLTVQAVNSRDATLTCGCVILTCIVFVVLLLIVDLLYALVDPRIKAQYTAKKRKGEKKHEKS